MIGSGRAGEPVLGKRPIVGLQIFLQRRLVILRRHAVPVHVVDQGRELARDEGAHLLDAAVQVDGRDERLVAVRKQRQLAAAASLLFPAPEQQVLAQIQTFGLPREGRRRDERGLRLRLFSLVEAGKLPEEHVGDDEAEHGVAQELQRFVVVNAAARVLVGARGVRHRVFEQPAVAEPVRDGLLQRLELVAQPHELPVGQLRAMAFDDATRVVGVVWMHRNPDLAGAVDGQGKN